jgi:type II secretory pathway component PulF
MVKAGEASGHVDQVLFRIADYLQKQNKLKNKVVSALMYPLIMVGVGIIVVTVLMTFVVPKIIKLVRMKGDELPTPTKILIAVSDFLRGYWSLLFAAIVGVFVLLGAVRRTKNGRFATDQMMLSAPIFGDLFKKQAVSRFAITMATLLKSGVPVLEALKIVTTIVNNSVVESVLNDVHDRIVEGQDIATPIKKSGLFPPTVGYMIAVGEQSGRLEEILDKLAEAYDEEIEVATQRMTALIEPILILGMSVVVTFIILSVLLPMLQLSNFKR